MIKKFKFKYLFLLIVILFSIIIKIHNIPKTISEVDIEYLNYMMPSISKNVFENLNFDEQIDFIKTIQEEIHENIYIGAPIPYSLTREPKDLYEYEIGFCYDLSRSIEKALQYSGFKTRHVAVYFHPQKRNGINLLFNKKSFSHSLTEVQTDKGWIIVDSIIPWIAKDKNQKIYSFKDLQKELAKGNLIDWKYPYPEDYDRYFEQEVLVIYGLYSRHGKFYPPFNFIPDYNLRELLYNF